MTSTTADGRITCPNAGPLGRTVRYPGPIVGYAVSNRWGSIVVSARDVDLALRMLPGAEAVPMRALGW